MQIEAEDETHPTCSGLDMTGECRDATVEEALHLVHHSGLAIAHKKVLGIKWKKKSALTKAMDKARYDFLIKCIYCLSMHRDLD